LAPENMTSSSLDKTPIKPTLHRNIGLGSALAIGVGTMIAAGIFTLSGLAVDSVGTSAIFAFLIAAIVATFTAFAYIEFSTIYPEAGGGYLYSQRTFGGKLAYFIGWSLSIGYAASCAFYISSFTSYFSHFVYEMPFHMSGAIILVILTLINVKGTKETGLFQIIVTLAKVGLIGWFIFGGLQSWDAQALYRHISTDIWAIGATSALVFITFFGFEAIATSAEEIKDPTRTIPRAILGSMVIVTLVYVGVVLVVVIANLSSYTERAMGDAAMQFLGPIGMKVIVAGALFSMVAAANATILAGSRVLLSMSRDGHLPDSLRVIHAEFKTPYIGVGVFSLAVLTMVVVMELEKLTHFADLVLLIALIFVNAALIYSRRTKPDLKRPFRVPLVPWIPLLGILSNLVLLFQIHIGPALLGLSVQALGLLVFPYLKGTREAAQEYRTGETVYEPTYDKGQPEVIVSLANPISERDLVLVAASVARPHSGRLSAFNVLYVPEQTPLSSRQQGLEGRKRLLRRAVESAEEFRVGIDTLAEVSHRVSTSVLNLVEEHEPELTVIGYSGSSRPGSTVRQITAHIKSDLALVLSRRLADARRVVVGVKDSQHARLAANLGAYVASSLSLPITLLAVTEGKDPEEFKEIVSEFVGICQEVDVDLDIEPKIENLISASDELIRSYGQDTIICLGFSEQWVVRRYFSGSVPDRVAEYSNASLIVAKKYEPKVHSILRGLVNRVLGFLSNVSAPQPYQSTITLPIARLRILVDGVYCSTLR